MDFCATSGNPGIFDDEARELGACIHYARYGRADFFRFAKRFRQILREGQYDVIHDHQDFASGWHFLLGTSELPPLRVTHVHNPAYQILNNYGVTFSRRTIARIGKYLIRRYVTHIAGTSDQVIEEYGFNSPSFEHVPKTALYCGFDPARFYGNCAVAKASVCREFGWPEDAKIILFAGRMDRSADLGHPQNHKNSGFAISVGIECARRDSRVRMLLAGSPRPSLMTLERRIAKSGFTERIVFAGVRSDIERLMLAADALLFPSRGEGLGMVAVEAQAAGLPVLASTAVPRECIIVPELVNFEEISAGEAVWAKELLELLSRPRNTSSANQRVSTSVFAIENSARALLTLYRQKVVA